MLLVPADPLRPRRPDDHFVAEATAAREAGIEVALVDHDLLGRPGGAVRAVSRVPAGEARAVYRGWMLAVDRYAAFAEALAGRGVALRTSAGQYRRAHELPGWYPELVAVTPRSTWTVGAERGAFDRARAELGAGPAVLRDYTKSMKHHWHEAALVPDLTDGPTAWRVASRFRELRGDDFAGGFVLRQFERFTSAEVRSWWVGGECVLTGPHPDTPADTPPPGFDPAPLADLVGGLDLPFVTVDLALREDGEWRVIELGDGQVSDRPTSIAPTELVAALFARR